MKATERLKVQRWGWWLILGTLLIIIGLLLISSPVVATMATIYVIGSLLVAAGIVHLFASFFERGSNHIWLHLMIAAFSLIIGLLMLFHPGIALATLTLLMAAYFLTSGIFRIIGSFFSGLKGWAWYFLNGLISLLLGVLILLAWPTSSLWVIGLFLGIDLLFSGITLFMMGWLKRRSFFV